MCRVGGQNHIYVVYVRYMYGIYGVGTVYVRCMYSMYGMYGVCTVYIRCMYDIFGRGITNYTVIYDVHVRFCPTLHMWLCTRAGSSHWHDKSTAFRSPMYGTENCLEESDAFLTLMTALHFNCEHWFQVCCALSFCLL